MNGSQKMNLQVQKRWVVKLRLIALECAKRYTLVDHVNDKNRLKLSLFIVKKMSTVSSSETYWPNLKYATLLKQLINERNKRKNTMELK